MQLAQCIEEERQQHRGHQRTFPFWPAYVKMKEEENKTAFKRLEKEEKQKNHKKYELSSHSLL